MIRPEDALEGLRLLGSLPWFLRKPVTLHEARRTLQHRFEHREDNFLRLAHDSIFERPSSLYHRLLALAGCEFGDLVAMVRRDGVDATLAALVRHGVYLTVDEFKGRRPIVRGSTTIASRPGQTRDTAAPTHLSVQTGGSRGAAAVVPIDLAYVRDRAIDSCLAFHAVGGDHWEHAVWGVPGGANMVVLLEGVAFGARVSRWFSQIDPRIPDLPRRYRWSARAMRWSSLGAPTRLPALEYAPLTDPAPILRWIAETRRAGGTPHLHTHASSAVRLCQAAERAGVRLDGVWLTAASEPTTAARLATMRRTGAVGWPQYASVEAGVVGRGCVRAEAPDEVHVFEDRLAVIQTSLHAVPAGLVPGALLTTSLSRTATALLLLNVSMGDVAELDRRRCGCPLERFGWTLHLRDIRSVEKLTAGGMTFLDIDIIRVLEEVLPGRFGGGPTDYQLVEEEGADGMPGLSLLVDPRVGPVPSNAVIETFLSAIGATRGAEKVMGLAWRDAKLLRVERRPPLVTPAGKILHLHVNGSARASSIRGHGAATLGSPPARG
jgi:hypothetical protein